MQLYRRIVIPQSGGHNNKFDTDSCLVYQYVSYPGLRATSNTVLSALQDNIESIRGSAVKDVQNGYNVFKIRVENGIEKQGERVLGGDPDTGELILGK